MSEKRTFRAASTARTSAAILAAAFMLASCGTSTPAPAKPTATASSTKSTTTIPTATAEATATDKGGKDTGATEAPTEEPGKQPSAPATKGPKVIAQFTSEKDPELEDYPISAKLVAEYANGFYADNRTTNAVCEGDVDITADKPSTTCNVDVDGVKRTIHVYGTYSSVQGPGLLMTLDDPLDQELADSFSEPGTEVLSFGAGDMWGVDTPVVKNDLATHVTSTLDAYAIPVNSSECMADASLQDGTNSVICTVDAEWGKSDATVIVTHIANRYENGILIVLPTPVD